jgi:hypothetical protein
MNDPLRHDEKLVTVAIARHFKVTWKPGEDPPDAYLQLPKRDIALEVTRLEELIIDEKWGGHKSRRSKDTTAMILANELDKTLRQKIPDDTLVILTLNSPITDARQTRAVLEKLIVQYVNSHPNGVKKDEIIYSNKIGIWVRRYEGGEARKVALVIGGNKSDRNVLENAWCILEDRIKTKTEKCRGIGGKIWLGLLNYYWVADIEIYRRALGMFHVEHPFSKILLVSLEGKVETLYSEAKLTLSQ